MEARTKKIALIEKNNPAWRDPTSESKRRDGSGSPQLKAGNRESLHARPRILRLRPPRPPLRMTGEIAAAGNAQGSLREGFPRSD